MFDSGIGGLSILRSLRASMPQQDFLYVADSGHAPYGERDAAHVIARSQAIAGWLAGQHVSSLVMACNTATAAAVNLLRASHPHLPIVGVEPALKPAVLLSQTGRIGVMATRGTLASDKFTSLLAAQPDPARFVLQPCDGLADAIEHSTVTGDREPVLKLCRKYTTAMGEFGNTPGAIDTLVLGCTHYPFAAGILGDLLGASVTLVDTGDAVARQVRRKIGMPELTGGLQHCEGTVSLFTTGYASALNAAARHWLGLAGGARLLHF